MAPRWLAALLVVAIASTVIAQTATASSPRRDASRARGHDRGAAVNGARATPIKHVVVIYQENVSFDHYFATYPNATNHSGQPRFHALRARPRSTASRARC